jgi:hypothetical protein
MYNFVVLKRSVIIIKEYIKTMLPLLNEKRKRLFLASLAKELGAVVLRKSAK